MLYAVNMLIYVRLLPRKCVQLFMTISNCLHVWVDISVHACAGVCVETILNGNYR